MKKNVFTLGLIAVAAFTLATNCAKVETEALNDKESVKEEVKGTPFEIVAGSTETKTTNDGMFTKWEATDAINLFYADAGTTDYTSAGKFESQGTGTSVTFKGTVGDLYDNNDWYAFYPYKFGITTPANISTYYLAVGGDQTQGAEATPTAHLCGEKFPVYGKVTNVAKATNPSITMKPAMSVVKVHVTNNSGAALTVNTVNFATEDYAISGQFYIDFTGDAPVFTEKSESTGKSAKLTVAGGKTLANGAAADFYIGIVPFVAASGKKLSVKVNNYNKELTLGSEATFSPGKVKTLNFNYDETITPASLPFSIAGNEAPASLSAMDGVTYSSITPQGYKATHDPYRIQCSVDGGFLQVFFDQEASKVSFGVKMIGGNKSTHFDVKGSSDGITFNQIERFTVSGAQNDVLAFETTEAINPSYRYIRLVFDKGTGSNVGLGPVSIAKPSTEPEIQAANITGVAVSGTTNTFSYTIKNFAGDVDDVEVSDVDGTVVTSAEVTTAGTVSYTVAPNYASGSAGGTITLSSTANSVIKVVNVTQSGETFSNTASSTITLAKNSGSDSFTITTVSFGWASTVTPETGMNLSISPVSGSKNAEAQAITINSTTEAIGTEQTLGTIVIYRNDNSSDPQAITITVKKAANAVGVSWVETDLSDLTSSDEFVIVGNGKSMSNGNGTGSAPTASTVTVSAGKITSAVTDEITWHLTGNSTDGYTFYPKGETETWLYCNTTANKSSNNNIRVGTGDRKVFILETNSEKNYLVTKDTYVKRFVCVYNDADWRGYIESSIVATDTKFYKKVTE